MGIALFAIALLGEPPAREMREGLERKYRITVEQEAGDRYAYRLRARMTAPAVAKLPKGMEPPKGQAAPQGGLVLDLRLTDYRATIGEQTVTSALIGGGQMGMEPNGLPKGLNVTGPQGPVWLPLLAFYLPAPGDDGKFNVPATPVAPGLDLVGNGTFAKGHYDLQGSLQSGGTSLGKLTISATLDASGWPTKAEGALVSEDGTYRFKVEKG